MMSQTTFFLLAVAAGFAIGFIYDVFRVARLAVKHADAVVQIEDAVFWLIASAGMFLFTLHVNNGEVRAFSIVGAALGMVLYFVGLSSYIIKILVAAVNILKKTIAAIIGIILIPFKFIAKLLSVLAFFVLGKIKLAEKPTKKLLQKSGRYAKMKKDSLRRSINILKKV
jgi:spore cortex biosynthesis protein YabQ